MTEKEIRKEAARALEELPEEFRSRLQNVEIFVARRPSRRLLRSVGLDPDTDTLYGIYEGTPLPERSFFEPPPPPDRITLFSEPLLCDFPDPEELKRQVRITVIHEIAHYFGMDDDWIEKLGY
ncbi:MAG TPA: metallopeptidase family protein [candidate division Zixibacteria bacterium]|nr:metallopeptidase family protein [candidate division Zixibacteria bacterium]